MASPVVTLLTDFGTGAYVAQMKGALLRIVPDLRIIDLAHDVPAQDVGQGAFLLWSAARHFPPDAIHVAVVDPGVGTDRRALLLECDRGRLVGPDNGLLWPAAADLGLRAAHALEPDRLGLGAVSPTFHGRDVFVPAAGQLAAGVPADRLGHRIEDPRRLELFDAVHEAGRGARAARARVLHVDAFGNAITNVRRQDLERLGARVGGRLEAAWGRKRLRLPLVLTYAQAPPGTALAVVGSSGLLELALRDGSAAKRLGLRAGVPLRLRRAA